MIRVDPVRTGPCVFACAVGSVVAVVRRRPDTGSGRANGAHRRPQHKGLTGRTRAPARLSMGLLLALCACAPVGMGGPPERGPTEDAAAGPAGSRAAPSAARPSPFIPAGHGTLRQDEITVAFRSGALQVKVTPLAEPVIRLTAPDTYRRLHALAERRRGQAARSAAGGEHALFLVSFFSEQPDAHFQPEDLQISQQGALLRPTSILPVTPGWGRQRIEPQDPQLAVYAFGGNVDFELSFTVRYGFTSSNAWAQLLPTLETERARVRARAGTGTGSPVRSGSRIP